MATGVVNDLANRRSDPLAAITTQNVDQLRLAWKIDTPETVSHTPLVAGGRVYFADWSGAIYCADDADGHLIWQKQVEQPQTMWPWYGFAGTGTLAGELLIEASQEGYAFGIDPASGDVAWRTAIADDPYSGSISTLLADDGLVYIGLSGMDEPLSQMLPMRGQPFTPSFRGKVIALEASTGQLAWSRALVESPHNGVGMWSSFALDAETATLFFTTGNNYTGMATELSDAMVAVQAKTGEIVWTTQAYAHDVWTMADQQGPDFDFVGGPQLFEATIDGQPRKMVGGASKSGFYWAFDRATGQAVWSTFVSYGGPLGGMHAEASIAAGRVYAWGNKHFATKENPRQTLLNVVALDAATGDRMWANIEAQPAALSAGFLSSDVYFVPALDGVLRGYRADDGAVVWGSPAVGAIASSLAVLGDALYCGTAVPQRFGGALGGNAVVAFRLGGK